MACALSPGNREEIWHSFNLWAAADSLLSCQKATGVICLAARQVDKSSAIDHLQAPHLQIRQWLLTPRNSLIINATRRHLMQCIIPSQLFQASVDGNQHYRLTNSTVLASYVCTLPLSSCLLVTEFQVCRDGPVGNLEAPKVWLPVAPGTLST